MVCNCKVLLYVIIILCALFMFSNVYKNYYNKNNNKNNKKNNKKIENMEDYAPFIPIQSEIKSEDKYSVSLDQNNDTLNKLDLHNCSQDCCKHTQWLPPNMIQEKNKNIKEGYVGSNLSCNNGFGNGGCVCLKQNDINMLQNKSGNSIPMCNN